MIYVFALICLLVIYMMLDRMCVLQASIYENTLRTNELLCTSNTIIRNMSNSLNSLDKSLELHTHDTIRQNIMSNKTDY